MTTHRVLLSLLCLVTLLLSGSAVQAEPSQVSRHLALGNPSGAVADLNQPANYLILRDQYAVSYHRDRGIPNWVAWHLQVSDLGDTPRYTGSFITDTSLPNGWYRVTHGNYTNSGYDRGHMTPSADRTASEADNQATFILTNIVPQAPANNQGLWAQLEEQSRQLVNDGNELYLVAGGHGSLGTLATGRLTIPASLWKVMLLLHATDGDDLARVTADTVVLAIWTPNDASVQGRTWQEYQTTVRCIEERTGLDFFASVDRAVQDAIEGNGCLDTTTGDRVYLPLVVRSGESVPTPMPTSPPAPTSTPTPTPTSSPAPTSTPTPTPIPTPTPTPVFPGCSVDPGPGVAPDAPVRIVTVDKANETVTLENVATTPIDLSGWRMCSIRGGQEHPIGGVIGVGATLVLPPPPSPIWNNSMPDPGALYDAQGALISYWSN